MDTRPQNQGGDFTVDFYEQMYLPGDWEVALAEMSYVGQSFPNIKHEDGEVYITYDASKKYATEFIVNYADQDLWITTEHRALTPDIFPQYIFMLPQTHTFPRNQYIWKNFKKAFNAWATHSQPTPTISHKVKFAISDEAIIVTALPSASEIQVTFSPAFVKLLSLKQSVFVFKSNTAEVSQSTTIVIPKPIPDDSRVVFKANPKIPVSIEYLGNIIVLPGYHWTIDTINAAWKVACESMDIPAIHIRSGEYRMELMIPLKNSQRVIIFKLSENLSKLLKYPQIFDNVSTTPLEYIAFPILKFDPVVPVQIEDTLHLTFNYYPTPKSLIENLNNIILSHINEKLDKCNVPDVASKAFSLDATDICTYTPIAECTVKLGDFMLKLLHLTDTTETNTAKYPMQLPSAIREMLYVHANIISWHFVNQDQRPLLRVINNSAKDGEQVMLSFPFLQYHPVARKFFSNIHTYITDSFSAEPLEFTKTVSYLLHFRQCPS
jgi:hypothetical protein